MATYRRSIRQHHVMGAGALATILGVLHFLLQNGLATGVIGSNFSEGLTHYGETVGAYGTVSSSRASTYSPNYSGYAPSSSYAPTQLVSYPTAQTQAAYSNQYANTYDLAMPRSPILSKTTAT
ncbi:MAG: hypothetical protein U0905_22260 [Pirellulales bacterium]